MGKIMIDAGMITDLLPMNSKGRVISSMGFTAMILEVISTETNTVTTMMNVPVNRILAPLSSDFKIVRSQLL